MIISPSIQELSEVARKMSEEMVVRDYDENGNSTDIRVKTPKEKEEMVYSCLYGAILTMNHFSPSLTREKVDSIIYTAETTLAAYDSKINCYLTVAKPLSDFYENLSFSGYLMCCLDAEAYTEPTITLCDTLEEAKSAFIDSALLDTPANTKEEVRRGLYFEKDNPFSLSYKYSDTDFVSGTLIPIRIRIKDSIVIYHHAYDGVDFSLCYVGSELECRRFLEYVKTNTDPNNEVDSSNKQLSIFNGNEYEIYTICTLF